MSMQDYLDEQMEAAKMDFYDCLNDQKEQNDENNSEQRTSFPTLIKDIVFDLIGSRLRIALKHIKSKPFFNLHMVDPNIVRSNGLSSDTLIKGVDIFDRELFFDILSFLKNDKNSTPEQAIVLDLVKTYILKGNTILQDCQFRKRLVQVIKSVESHYGKYSELLNFCICFVMGLSRFNLLKAGRYLDIEPFTDLSWVTKPKSYKSLPIYRSFNVLNPQFDRVEAFVYLLVAMSLGSSSLLNYLVCIKFHETYKEWFDKLVVTNELTDSIAGTSISLLSGSPLIDQTDNFSFAVSIDDTM